MNARMTLDEIEQCALRALVAAGAAERQAAPVARSIREAEAEGTRAIGLGYLPYYCHHLRVGKIIGDAVPTLSIMAPALIRVDAKSGFAHPAYETGEDLLVQTANAQGIALLGITNAYACGILGYFTNRLASKGLMAIMVANASSTMAPHGGKTPFFGTNPWSFAAPRAGDPLVIDASSSATAYVNLVKAAAAGEKIPPTWALDAEGRPTTDPVAGMSGSIAPAGGHKGAALALMVEVLAAGLTGANWSYRASSLGDDEGGAPNLGQALIAIKPDGLSKDAATTSRLDEMLAAMTDEPGTRIPGERRHENRRRAQIEGVELDEPLIDILRDLKAIS